MNLGRLWDRYRIPLLVGVGGLSALFSINARRQAQQAAAAAATAAQPLVVPGDTAGAFQQGLGAGAALYGQAVGQGLAPTETALGLAGSAVQGAAALAAGVTGDYLGFGSSLVGALAGLVQPVTQPPAPGGGAQPPSTPPPSPAADAFAGYYAVTRPSTGLLFTVDQSGHITGQRTYAFQGGRAPVRRSTSSTLHWRYEGGPVNGWSLIPGRSPSFEIQKRWRRADGTFYFTTISNTGS